mgnify:CR=1 FL=1
MIHISLNINYPAKVGFELFVEFAGFFTIKSAWSSRFKPDFLQRNPENRDKANPTASQRRFGIGHILNSMLPHHSLAVPCIISLITIFNLRW